MTEKANKQPNKLKKKINGLNISKFVEKCKPINPSIGNKKKTTWKQIIKNSLKPVIKINFKATIEKKRCIIQKRIKIRGQQAFHQVKCKPEESGANIFKVRNEKGKQTKQNVMNLDLWI